MNNKVTVLKAKKQSKGSSAFYIVYNSVGQVIGFLEKFKNTSTETHPWKAFGMHVVEGQPQVDPNKFKAFYEEQGGRAAAIAQVQTWSTGTCDGSLTGHHINLPHEYQNGKCVNCGEKN